MRSVILPVATLLLLGNVADPASSSSTADIAQIPPQVKAMLDAAMESGSESEVAIVEKYARSASPDNALAITELTAKWRADRRVSADSKLRSADFLALLKGRIEVGGFLTTGNTDNIGVTANIAVSRDGYRWRHKLALLAEYQESAGVTSREHYRAAYEPNYKIDDRAYIYGAAQFESDRYLGYFERYSGSVGAGYSVVKSSSVGLDLELGPAYRYTRFSDETVESNIAARGSARFGWTLASGVRLTQDASAYLQSANSTLTGRTALAAKLFGPVSAQLSYDVSYETKPPAGRVHSDSATRASVAYSF
jgi:putative salt-induced outer membrane protein